MSPIDILYIGPNLQITYIHSNAVDNTVLRNAYSVNISNLKQPSCKKKSAALRKAMVKKDVKSKVAAKKWL